MTGDATIVPLFAAGMPEAVITLLILVGYAIVSAIFKKKEPAEGQEMDMPAPPVRRPRRDGMAPGAPAQPPTRTVNWEDELRRMLGEPPLSTPPAAPPPVIIAPAPRPAPPIPQRRIVIAKPVFEEEGDVVKGLNVPMPTLTESARAYERASHLDETVGANLRQRSSMAESTAAHQQAQALDTKVAEHFRHVTDHSCRYDAARRAKRVSPEVTRALAMFDSGESARSAMIAGLILGPPKALEV